jgi:hypothetical protein
VSTDFRTKIPSRGTHASRPDPADAVLYSCSDHGLVYRSDGSTWTDWLILGTIIGGGGPVDRVGPFAFSTATVSGAVTSLTIAKPALWAYDVAENDVLYAFIGYFGSAPTISLTGWTLLEQHDQGASSAGQALLRKVAGASEPTDYTFTASSSARLVGGILAVRGADTTTPEADSDGQAQSNLSITAPSITAGAGSPLLVGGFTIRTEPRVIRTPSGMQSLWHVVSPSGEGTSGVSQRVSIEIVSAGATGTRVAVATGSSTTHSNAGQLVAINAA